MFCFKGKPQKTKTSPASNGQPEVLVEIGSGQLLSPVGFAGDRFHYWTYFLRLSQGRGGGVSANGTAVLF